MGDKNYDYINPQHYVQDDGKQTWERMVEKYGVYKTAIFCELNAFKYQDRRGKKPNEEVEREDKKIKWYEDKAADLYELLDDMGDKIIYDHLKEVENK